LLIFIPFLRVPASQDEFIYLLCAACIFFFAVLLYVKNHFKSLKIFLLSVLFSFAAASLMVQSEKYNIEEIFFIFIHYLLLLSMIYLIYSDYKKRDYKSFYRLDQIEKNVSKTVVYKGKRRFLKIPFTKKSLFYFDVKRDFTMNLSLAGYYFVQLNNGAEK
jgi:hypothetical protein